MNLYKFASFLILPTVFLITACNRGAEPSAIETTRSRYQDDLFTAVAVTPDLAYGSAVTYTGDTQTLLLDLYEPAGDTNSQRAVIIWIHGGGFVNGTRTDPDLVALSRRFAMKGYVTVSIDYRLVSEAQYYLNLPAAMRAAMQDAKSAIRWLRANQARYRLDPQRIAIGGSSAGAYTALLAAYLADEGTGPEPDIASAVGAVIDLWGALPDPAIMQPGAAPLIIIHGTADTIVPFVNAEKLAARARLESIPYGFYPLEGAEHGPWQYSEQIIAWITPFLLRYLIKAE
jgi:acetyl esterase/lipase